MEQWRAPGNQLLFFENVNGVAYNKERAHHPRVWCWVERIRAEVGLKKGAFYFNQTRQLNGNSFYVHEVNINYLIKKQPLVHTGSLYYVHVLIICSVLVQNFMFSLIAIWTGLCSHSFEYLKSDYHNFRH